MMHRSLFCFGLLLSAALSLSAGLTPEAREVATAILGRAPTEQEEALAPRKLWPRVAAHDELLADWLAQDEKLPVRTSPLSVAHPRARLEDAFKAVGAPTEGTLAARLAAYRALCAQRRARRLAAFAKEYPRWVYCRHYTQGGSFYAYTEALTDARGEKYMPGGWSALCLLEAQPDGFWKETVLKEHEGGCFRDAEMTPDGKRVIYSFRANAHDDDLHLYEMDLATRETRQLTFRKGHADYEPCCLPDGSIVFNSTRCVQIVDCAFSDVSNLYRCTADGTDITRVAYDQVHDNFPTLTWDGRVLYTRWEYNDRSQIHTQMLFGMNLDGTQQRAVYGDNSWFPTSILHSRQVPDSPLVFAISSGHHCHQAGELIRIDPRVGRQEGAGISSVGPLRPVTVEREDAAGQQNQIACYPYPLNENELVVTFLPEGWPMHERDRNRVFHDAGFEPFGLYWMHVDGARELLYPRFDGRRQPGRAVPVKAQRPQPARPSAVDPARTNGTFYVQNVYEGLAMKGVKKGTVKTLRIIGLDYRVVGLGLNGNSGEGGGAVVTTPVSIGRGSWDPKIVLGDVPVEPDGSCSFNAPANWPWYFMLLDEKGRAIQTMRSWTMLQPGENASCVGCHEDKNDAPTTATARGLAARKPAVDPRPVLESVRGLSFPRDVQPILDRRCVSCHDGTGKGRAKLDLRNTPVYDTVALRRWTRGYLSLVGARVCLPEEDGDEFYIASTDKKILNWINAASEPTVLKPYSAGSATSTLFTELFDKKGHAPDLTEAEQRILAMWVDLCVPYCGTYDEDALWNDAQLRLYNRLLEKRRRANDVRDPE